MAVNLLVSFAFFGTADMAQLRLPCGRLMVDSGAYTAWSKGKPIDLHAYAEFLDTWAGVIDHAVTLDVIGDPAATARNTRWLHNRGHAVLPVFTRGSTVAEFDAMVRDCGYVCVGGGVGLPSSLLVPRLGGLQRRALEQGGGIHALGVGNLPDLARVRPYSADASNLSNGFLYGTVTCFNGRVMRSVALNDRRKIKANLVHFRNAGLDMAALTRSGRMPEGAGASAGRTKIMRAGSLGHSCADETTVRYRVPAPTGVADTEGTHLYSAVTTAELARPVVELDHLLHDPGWTPPPMWAWHRDQHERQCRHAARKVLPA